MPSKRHGAQTRKQWLRMRLELARDRTGAFDVERLLRATRFYYNEFDYTATPDVRVSYTLTLPDVLIGGMRCEGYETDAPFDCP